MIIRSLILLLMFLGCETKKKQNNTIKKSDKEKSVIQNNKFFIGDINNDKIQDTAFINLKRNIETDEIECGEKNRQINIKFSKNIPEIRFEQSLRLFISKTDDLNNDNANEILIFSHTNEGWWNYIYVYSFDGKKWNELAKVKAFITENKDFENRITKENDNYYLIGDDQWNEDENGNFLKTKVKI